MAGNYVATLCVSTCGTSLLTNRADDELRLLLSGTANLSEDQLTDEQREKIEARLREQVQRLQAGKPEQAAKMCAELKGILEHASSEPSPAPREQHILLHTDTWQGEIVANALCDWLRSQGLEAHTHRLKSLSTRSMDDFRSGIDSLIVWCDETLEGYRSNQYNIVFNLTGGFKSLQGFMQTLGMFYADELIYGFETGELLRIPRLPLEFESSVQQAVRQHLPVFRRLQFPHFKVSVAECQGIPEAFLYQLEDSIDLNNWGRLVWQRYRKQLYQDDVLPSLSDKLRFSDNAQEQARQLTADRRVTFNERMDDLSCYLESGQTQPINRLDFKRLRGNPKPPSTHECDLWADRGAWRAFGHYEGATFIIDRIGPGLH